MVQFPKTLAAAQAADQSTWRIGDALLKEAEGEYQGRRGLNAVVAELAEHGLDYTNSYLNSLRWVASHFPKNRRHADLAWGTHRAAGNPDMLDAIVKGAKKAKHKVTEPYVVAFVRGRWDEDQRRRLAQLEEGEREAEAAQAKMRRAKERQQSARDEAERRAAIREREEAAEEERLAWEKAEAAKVSRPGRFDLPAPHEDEVVPMVARMAAIVQCGKGRQAAEEARKLVEASFDDLKPVTIAALIEMGLEAANAWTEFVAFVRRGQPGKTRHLRAIND